MWFAIIVAAICCLLVLFLTEKDPKPINGVYKQPGKWFYIKYWVFRIMYFRKQIEFQRTARLPRHTKSIDIIERAQPLSSNDKAFDAVFFIAANKEGFYLAAGTERRKNGMVNALCYLMVPGLGLLCSDNLPETKVKSDANNEDYSAGGVLFQMVVPMRKWRIRFQGKMHLLGNRNKKYDVKFDADWVSKFKHFDYETDMHPSAVARAFAKETWSKQYFKMLQDAHQSHYEQMGKLRGYLTVDGEKQNISAQAFRDHSFGAKRDWDLMHRYAFHILFFEDGSSLVVAVICQPCTSSWLEVGYTCSKTGEMEAVESCDLKLYRHGEGGTPPTDYSFHYTAGGQTRLLEVQVIASSKHRVDEARMTERFVQVRNGGMPGWGVSEWHYHEKLINLPNYHL